VGRVKSRATLQRMMMESFSPGSEDDGLTNKEHGGEKEDK